MAKLRTRVLSVNRITKTEVDLLRSHLLGNQNLGFEDVRLLVDLATQADQVCPEFDPILFPSLRSVMLEDGIISPEEQVLLMQLFADRPLRMCELQFLAELYDDVETVTPALKSVFASSLGLTR